jgi:hypothetical protein
MQESFHATTIVSVRRDGKVVIGGDGQVTLGNTVVKANARKLRGLARTATCWPDSPAPRPMRSRCSSCSKPSSRSTATT